MTHEQREVDFNPASSIPMESVPTGPINSQMGLDLTLHCNSSQVTPLSASTLCFSILWISLLYRTPGSTWIVVLNVFLDSLERYPCWFVAFVGH